MNSPNYAEIARLALETYERYTAADPVAISERSKREPLSAEGLPALDFDKVIPEEDDLFIAGNFVEGTWVCKLESEVEGEQGLYNIAVDPTGRTKYALVMPTKDYHPQSAPLRPGYLTHAHRLLVELEKQLGGRPDTPGAKVIAVYDCGEKSGVREGHKCIRFYVTKSPTPPKMPHRTVSLPDFSSSDSRVEIFTQLLNNIKDDSDGPFIPKNPHYNLVMTRSEMILVPRTDDGFLDGAEGRWDGARLVGIPL